MLTKIFTCTRAFVIVFMTTFLSCITVSVVICGDFKIGVFTDPVSAYYYNNTSPLQHDLAVQYFAQLDTFGIDFVIGPGVNQLVWLCDTFNIDLALYNVGSSKIPITPTIYPNYFEDYVNYGFWWQMEAERDFSDTTMGYAFGVDSATGENDIPNGNRYARVSLHSPGYLLRKLDTSLVSRGWVHATGDIKLGWNPEDSRKLGRDSLMYFNAYFRMKYKYPTMSPDSSIARIIIDGGNLAAGYYNNDDLVTIHIIKNDTIIETPDTVYQMQDVTPKFDGVYYGVNRIGWPAKTIREVFVSDFPGEDQWGTISAIYRWDLKAFKVYWLDRADLYIDNFFAADSTSYYFKNTMDKSAAGSLVQGRYDSITNPNLESAIWRWYPHDEPYPGTLYPIRQYRELLQYYTTVDSNRVFTVNSAPGAGNHFIEVRNNITGMPEYTGEDYFYSCRCSTFTTSMESDPTNIQYSVNAGIKVLEIEGEKARAASMPFIPILSPCDYWHYEETDATSREYNWVRYRKEAFGPDIKLQAYLSIAYGAEGIVYWPYTSTGPAVPPESEPYNKKYKSASMVLGGYENIPNVCDSCPCYSLNAKPVPWSYRAFVIDSLGSIVKVNGPDNWDKWEAGRQVHAVLDSLSYLLNGRTSISAGRWDDLAGGPFKYITSQEYGDSAAFIQWAEFTSNGTPYYMLINRRTWPGPEACQCPENLSDTQHVYFALNAGPSGDVWAIDAYTQESTLLIDSCGPNDTVGYKTGTVLLPPGEAIIFRLNEARYNWKGSFSGINHFPEGGTHYLSGDVTIGSGSTFTIGQGATLNAIANTDSCASGSNTGKTELIVNGNLRALGAADKLIHFKATTTANAAWYGIRVINNGSADIRNAHIENAYIGYQNNSSNGTDSDSLQVVDFIKCKPYGAVLNKSNMKVDNIYVLSDLTTAVGIHIDSIADLNIRDCGFDYVKYAIEIDHSTPVIKNASFAYCRYGVWIDKNTNTDTANISGCYFETSEQSSGQSYDIVIGQNNSRCRIDSTTFDQLWSYGVLNIYDDSRCHIRRCRFQPSSAYPSTTVYAVYTHGDNTDMGASYDEDSLNYFKWGVALSGEYYIYNSDASEYTEARSCCFLDEAEDPSKFYGPIHLADSEDLSNCLASFPSFKDRVVSDTTSTTIPSQYSMYQNYPNPFNPTTTIAYNIPAACNVKIIVYNILGQIVTTLLDEYKSPGQYAIIWDGTDIDGRPVASGLYFYQMVAGDYVSSKKMVMMK